MNDIQAVTDAALLIHDGVVRECGPARRIENLAEARSAVEIDVGGRVVIPAFVEPDAVLVTAGEDISRRSHGENAIATTSKRRLEARTLQAVEDWVRHGVLALGATTHGASDLRDARKLLNVQKMFQARPLRIRSVFAPHVDWCVLQTDKTVKSWASAIVGKRLAGLLELELDAADERAWEGVEHLSRIAVPEGFILRLRSAGPLSSDAQRVVGNTGAISVIAPGVDGGTDPEFARASCVSVLTGADILAGKCNAAHTRALLDDGIAVALGSGYSGFGKGSYNPQYLLHLACTELGMSIEEAITAVTWNAACSLRMSTVAGSVDPGKQADLVMMDVGDYRDMAERPGHNDVYMVVRAGKPVYRRAGLLSLQV